jgi:predicted enzyme related to lactoylglutathione lyase
MSERTEYKPGTPSWVDHSSPDPGAAAEFYGALFGWETTDQMPEDADGRYFMATLRGKNVAAIGSNPVEGVPPHWNTYITVESADDAAAAVKEAGGMVAMEPFDVFDAGRMAACADQAGAFFMVWEPKDNIGAQLVNEPNTFSWSELTTNDVEGSKEFYSKVFGWNPISMDFAGGEYTVWNHGGVEPVSAPPEEGGTGLGGMMDSSALPDGTPNFWQVYFNVEDADATAAKAQELGGQVMNPAFDAPGVGRIVVLGDPQGAIFAAITPVAT